MNDYMNWYATQGLDHELGWVRAQMKKETEGKQDLNEKRA